jgi:hypothetical protein
MTETLFQGEKIIMIKQKTTLIFLFSIVSIKLIISVSGRGSTNNPAGQLALPHTQQATLSTTVTSQSQQQPAMVRNGQPGEMHKRLDALVGKWDVVMTFYIAGDTAEKPLIANGMICNRQWIAETGNRHLRDVTQGMVGNNPYYRLGILSYSTMDRRYEWNTVDALNANMMTYKGEKNSASMKGDIVMTGEFTDQGVLGDAYAGKNVGQRTVIKIESPNRHVFELYLTPPGEQERLATRGTYTRRK